MATSSAAGIIVSEMDTSYAATGECQSVFCNTFVVAEVADLDVPGRTSNSCDQLVTIDRLGAPDSAWLHENPKHGFESPMRYHSIV